MTVRRTWALRVIVASAAGCLLGIIAGLFVGTPRHRSIRSWLAVTALLAAWLAVATSWRDIAWAGQRWRTWRQLDAFETIAAPLRKEWPSQDGVTKALGPFNAYPTDTPTVVMLLTSKPWELGAAFRAIERSPDGALRFDLAGKDGDAWLEWHPAPSAPASFVGGLETQYELERSSSLGDGWFLTRYRSEDASGIAR
jgi:hypothetical protein